MDSGLEYCLRTLEASDRIKNSTEMKGSRHVTSMSNGGTLN